MIPSLGFCLGTRAQMFTLTPGLPNSLAPRKRPRTTLSPSLALRDGEPYLAFGTPGGDQQDQWTLAFLLAHRLFGLDLQAAIDAPAFHTEHFPSSFYPHGASPRSAHLESRFGDAVVSALRARGHDVVVRSRGPSAASRRSRASRAGCSRPRPTRAGCRATPSAADRRTMRRNTPTVADLGLAGQASQRRAAPPACGTPARGPRPAARVGAQARQPASSSARSEARASRRARCTPTQTCGPWANARWRRRLGRAGVELVRAVEHRRVAVGRRDRDPHQVPALDLPRRRGSRRRCA